MFIFSCPETTRYVFPSFSYSYLWHGACDHAALHALTQRYLHGVTLNHNPEAPVRVAVVGAVCDDTRLDDTVSLWQHVWPTKQVTERSAKGKKERDAMER